VLVEERQTMRIIERWRGRFLLNIPQHRTGETKCGIIRPFKDGPVMTIPMKSKKLTLSFSAFLEM
jgi:hypothetical protein